MNSFEKITLNILQYDENNRSTIQIKTTELNKIFYYVCC